jgi:F-type H+-transporting ATPase subunit delta
METVTNTYALAFADVVVARRLDAAKTLTELKSVLALLEESVELRQVWENPAIPADQKRRLLDAIVREQRISRPVRNFLAVLIDHRRMPFLPHIVQQLEREIDERLGFAEAEITTARDLNDSEKRVLEKYLQQLTGEKVKAHYLRDRTLLGGVVVKVGSTIYDGSVLGQLQRMREQIASSSN